VKKAAEILAKILDEKNRNLGQGYSSVFGAWSQIVGDSLAEHSRIYEIRNRSLFIEVDHPGWMQLLLFKKPQILRLVKRKYPALDIRNLRVKVNLSYPVTIPEDTDTDSRSRKAEVTADEQGQEELDRMLSTVSQDELRKRLKRLFLKSLERDNSENSPC
jgi:hypothetical protein